MEQQDRAESIVHAIAEQIAVSRKKTGLSHNVLANKAGVTRAAISYIESGKRKPSLLLTLKLAHGLGIELSDLLKEAEKTILDRQ
jgi:DNA-binding XRE family transcriptional regulator